MRTVTSVVVVLSVLVMAACGGSTAPQSTAQPAAQASLQPTAAPTQATRATVPLVYGVSAFAPETLPVWTAQDQGFDVENGLAISVVSAEGGSKGLLVLAGGNFQAMEVGLAPVVLSNAHGADVRVINSNANAIPYTIFGTKGITAENAAETLRGTKIGISSFGSESDVSISLFLRGLGLSRDRDVTVVQVGGPATRLAALQSGAISASPLSGPEKLQARQLGFAELIDMSQSSDWLFDAAVVNKAFLDAHRDQALGLLRALIKGTYFSRSHPVDAKRILAAGLKYDDPALIDATYDEFMHVVPPDMTPRDSGIREVINQVKQLPDANVTTEDPSAYVDLSLLDELRKQGFFDQMRRMYSG